MKKLILLLLVLFATDTHAQTITWTGTVSSDWHNGCNWDLGVVPTCTHDVVLPNVTNKPNITATACVNSLEPQIGCDLTIQSSTLLHVGCAACTPTDNSTSIAAPTAYTYS